MIGIYAKGAADASNHAPLCCTAYARFLNGIQADLIKSCGGGGGILNHAVHWV